MTRTCSERSRRNCCGRALLALVLEDNLERDECLPRVIVERTIASDVQKQEFKAIEGNGSWKKACLHAAQAVIWFDLRPMTSAEEVTGL